MKNFPWILAAAAFGVAAYVVLNQPSPRYATGSSDVEEAADKTSLWGTKQRVTGSGSGLLGKAKEGIGDLTGNDELAGEGVADQVAGAVKDGAGQVAHAVGQTIQDLNR